MDSLLRRMWCRSMFTDRRFRQARLWSNSVLRRICKPLSGDVIHVSAWRDEDKEGGRYKDYFPVADSYTISNYSGYRGYQDQPGEIFLDLTAVLPKRLRESYDVVLNHTTLEHIFDVQTAYANLCRLSRDLVITVVPFAQVEHRGETFSDFWRFTPHAMAELSQSNGLQAIYQAANHDANSATYVVTVASRKPGNWTDGMPPTDIAFPLADWIGATWWERMRSRF